MKNTSISIDVISKTSGDFSCSEDVPSFFKKYEIPGAVNKVIYGSSGYFYFQELHQKESSVTLRYTNCLPAKDDGFIFMGDKADLRLQFALSNNFYFNEEGIGKREMREGSFNMLYVPFLKSEQAMCAGRWYSNLSIHFSRSYLDNWIDHYPFLNDFLNKLHNEETTLLCDNNQITSVQMDSIIKQLLQNRFKGVARSIYVDLKIKELFILVLDKASNCPTTGQASLSKIEVERFCEAKDVLLKNIQNPMSLKQMSRKFGINIKKIKSGFKQLYEKTPFNLLLSTRMEKAKAMLTCSEMGITEIADEIGYDNKHSFSKAFKKYFGYPPGKFRKIKEEPVYKYSTLDN